MQRLLHPKASPTPWTRAGQTDIRVVAATNRDLELPLARGEFREDLYYRLNVVEIRIPPLRDRKEEILIRAARFLAKFNQQYGWSRQLSPETTARLVEYSWGGNVRELENIIRRMVVLNDGEQAFARSPGVGAGCRADGPRGSAERVQWNRAEAARILKVSYRTVLNKIAECQLGGSSDHVMPCLTISSSRSCSDLIAHVPEFR